MATTEAKGLGDVIADTLKKVGVQPCGGCQKRQEWLNKISGKGVGQSGK